jgi:hypothetical protein
MFTQASREIVERAGELGQSVHLIAIALLVVLLVEYDLLRAYFPARRSQAPKALGTAIVPLLIVFVIIVLSRWWQLQV